MAAHDHVTAHIGGRSPSASKALERQQLEFRCCMRIQELRASAFDEILNNYLLLTGNEMHAMAIAERKAPLPQFKSFRSLIDDAVQDDMDEVLEDILVMMRVDDAGRDFWTHIAQMLTSAAILDKKVLVSNLNDEYGSDLSQNLREKMHTLHQSCAVVVRDRVDELLDRIGHDTATPPEKVNSGGLKEILYMTDHKTLSKHSFFGIVKETLAYKISCRWIESFEKHKTITYESIVKKHSLEQVTADFLRCPEDGVGENTNFGTAEMSLMERARTHAQGLLTRWKICNAIRSEETLLFARSSDKEKRPLLAPEYVARVTWGVEWNNYNRTHYDAENPPPSIEKGYQIDIAYPNVPRGASVRFEKLPTERGWEDSVCLLRIFVGEIYEDLVFIVRNAPMNTNPHQGYRCELQHGVFSFYFTLKPLRYKRI